VVSKITNTGSLDLGTKFQTGSDHREQVSVLWLLFLFTGSQKEQFRLKEKSGGTRSMELHRTAIFPEEE